MSEGYEEFSELPETLCMFQYDFHGPTVCSVHKQGADRCAMRLYRQLHLGKVALERLKVQADELLDTLRMVAKRYDDGDFEETAFQAVLAAILKTECICSEHDGKGRSTCGVPCPVHTSSDLKGTKE